MLRRKDPAEYSNLHVVGLVAAIAQRQPGAQKAFEELRQQFNWLVVSTFYKVCRGLYKELLEDASQTVWLKVWEKVRPVKSDKQFFAFLITVARNSIKSLIKNEAKHSSVQIEDAPEQEGNFPDVEQSLFNSSDDFQDLLDLQEILRQLKSTDRLIILLYDHDFSFEEIQFLLGEDMASDAEIIDRHALRRYSLKKLSHEQIAEVLSLRSAVIARVRFYRAKHKVEVFLDTLEAGDDQQRLRAVWHRFIGK
jgi:RNA polymerase sigma factor (sigma-70 family)